MSASTPNLPKHVAIIMDGNGRWASRRGLPRIMGHRAGVESVRDIVKSCANKKIEALSLFAFSSENWRRPKMEVSGLMELLFKTLQKEIKQLHENHVNVQFIGDLSKLSKKLQKSIQEAEVLTHNNSGLKLVIAVNYGGRWDIVEAAKKLMAQVQQGELKMQDIDEHHLSQHMALARLPAPDLFIRTSGEQRLSNFFLWQLAYTELYFTNLMWPDFRAEAFEAALTHYANRERRFGHTSEQLTC